MLYLFHQSPDTNQGSQVFRPAGGLWFRRRRNRRRSRGDGAEAGVKFDSAGLLGDLGDFGMGNAGAGDNDDVFGLHRTCDAGDAGNPDAI